MAIIMSNVNMAAKDYKAKSKLQIDVKLIKRLDDIFQTILQFVSGNWSAFNNVHE